MKTIEQSFNELEKAVQLNLLRMSHLELLLKSADLRMKMAGIGAALINDIEAVLNWKIIEKDKK